MSLSPPMPHGPEEVHILDQNELRTIYQHYEKRKNSEALIILSIRTECYVASMPFVKKIEFRGKPFYAKGRAYSGRNSKKKDYMPVLNFLTGYWQLAKINHVNEVSIIIPLLLLALQTRKV